MNHTITSESQPVSKPPVSERKASANRANAQRSTGPRTAVGKARSSLNALRHGILAKAAFNLKIDGAECRAEFEAIVAGLAQEFQPRTMSDHLMVQQLAGCYWRLAKVWRYEQEAAWRMCAHAIGMQGRRDGCRAPAPIVSRQRHLLEPERIRKVDDILADRGLLGHARRGSVAESSGPVTPQIRYQHAVASLCEWRSHTIVRVSVVGKTVQQNDRKTLRVAALFV